MTPTPSDFGNPPSRNSSSSSKTMSDPFIISAPRKDVPKGPSDCYSSTGVSDPFTDSHQYIMPMVNIPHNYCQNPQVTGIDQSVAYYILQGYPVPHRPMALIYPGRMPQGLPPRPHHMFGPQQAPQMQAPRAQSYQTAQPPNPQTQTQSRPTMFHGAFQGQVTLERVAQPDVMPFANITASQSPPQWGVMKIENLPYSVTKQEIVQLLGRHARTLTPDLGCPIHIIMERSTAKTMDCYVEFLTPADAEATVRRLNSIMESGRPPRLGHRRVDLTVSSQDELLKDLFPRAKCIQWRNGVPHLVPNTDPYSSGFQGFLTSEEVLGVVRHAEQPHRSPFSAKCPQRTYESMISTIWKFPWYATTMYTVADRDALFQAINRQILALTARIAKEKVIGLDHKLVNDLLRAGSSCPAFNERQKFTLLCNSEALPPQPILFPNLRLYWPFDTLVKRPNATEHEIMFYAGLVQKALAVHDIESEQVVNSYKHIPTIHESPYGNIWVEFAFHNNLMKWKDAAQLEIQVAKTLVVDGLKQIDRQLRDIAMRNLNGHVPQAVPSSSSSSIDHIKEATRRRRATLYSTPCRQTDNSNSNTPSFAGQQSSENPEPVSSVSESPRLSEVSSYASECSETTSQSQRSSRSRLSLPATPFNHDGTGIHFGSAPMSSPSRLPPSFELYHHLGAKEEESQHQRLTQSLGGHRRNFSTSL
ncbi:hypothetical protein VTN96DRAFT_1270 [Rasamsonia emersonii]